MQPFHLTRLVLIPALLWAAPGVDRVMRKSEHFELLIDQSQSSRLDSLGAIAESSWQKLSTITGYRPSKKIRIVFHDEEDYANGWALASNNWVNIWLLPQPFEMRGGTDWIRNVLSHELSHLFTLRALGMDGHLVSVGVIGGVESDGFEGSVGISASPNDLEAWLAEGLAQVGAESCGNDSWDSHRDLLEHVAWKSGRTLPDGLLRTFWGDSRESELVYNQGYSFLRWVLANGKMDLPKLLREGRRSSLRLAIETSMGRRFPELLNDWKGTLAQRHGEPKWTLEPGRSLAPPSPAASWIYESGAVGDGMGRFWMVSSRANDFGHGSLWEGDQHGIRKLVKDAYGRPRLSSDGKRLAVILEASGPDRRTIRDLWVYQTDCGSFERITSGARVQDVEFHPFGFAAIVRSGGANQAVLLDDSGSILARLPSAPTGDLIQIAADSSGGVTATSMGSDGFRLLRLASDSTWQPLDSLAGQARDPLYRSGRLWYSSLDSGRWVARSRTSSEDRPEARFEGGTFSPFPLDGDSLLVARFQPEGQIACKVPRDADVHPLALGAPSSLPVSSIPSAARPPLRAGLPTEIPSLVGYGFTLGIRHPKEEDGAFRIGTKGVIESAVFASNSSMENTVEADATMLVGNSRQNNAKDFGFMLSARTEAWPPILSASYSTQQTTVEYLQGSDPNLDPFLRGDTIPFFTSTEIQLGITQYLTANVALETRYTHTTEGFGAHGINDDESTVMLTSDKVQGAFGWQSFERGRHGVLSGFAVSAVTSRIWNKLESKTRILPNQWIHQARLKLAQHIARRLLLGATLDGVLYEPYQYPSKATGSIKTSVGIPLAIPTIQLPVTRNLRWTLVDPILRLGHNTSIRPQSFPDPDEFRPRPLANTSARWLPLDEFRTAATRSNGPDTKVSQLANIDLSWKAITLSNALSSWNIGMDVPITRNIGWSEVCWKASLSL